LAIFVPTDNHALELCMACSHAGIPIPESVAILGVDNHEATCCVGYPARSSVDIQARKIGWEAAGLMDHLLGGGAAPAEPILVEPSHVAVRRSTDVFAVGDPRIAQALKVIWTPGGERLDVPGLVKGTGLNRRTFERRFREATGSSPSVALRKARVECAKKMILDTHLGFPEIAERVGYATPEHFSQVFRSLTGCTPSAFRKQVAAARAGGDGAEEQGRSRDHVAK